MKDKRAESIGEVDLSELKFPIIAIYRHPADYPNKYVARVFDITRPTDTVVVKDSCRSCKKISPGMWQRVSSPGMKKTTPSS